MKRQATSGSDREGESTDAEHRGGAARSSDEGPVMGLRIFGGANFLRNLLLRQVSHGTGSRVHNGPYELDLTSSLGPSDFADRGCDRDLLSPLRTGGAQSLLHPEEDPP